jgi:lipopolysaccharide transport system ATP-binding protein
MKPIIKVENLSKHYKIGALNPGYVTFRETLAKSIIAPFKKLKGNPNNEGETIWAIKDINFTIEPGEVVGLIGYNGAGKSTLLKIISRITTPTTGRTEVYGRIGSLLEVGTGFHPDLTGRENVFLNGAVLGIKQNEIARRFDEIVAFSEIEKFIDTPVKWYSSGMYLRLAFSVAAHLDSEVLIMDEVLAVGDILFQQKCLKKMNEIRSEGRTILFVSHNMNAVTQLCKRAILLEKGRIIKDGPATQVISEHIGHEPQQEITNERVWIDVEEAPGNEIARLRKVRVSDEDGNNTKLLDINKPIRIELTYDILQPGYMITPKIDLINEHGTHIFSSYDINPMKQNQVKTVGQYTSVVRIPGNLLMEGIFFINASITTHIPESILHAHINNVVKFQVIEIQSKDVARADYSGSIGGVIRPLLDWTTSKISD